MLLEFMKREKAFNSDEIKIMIFEKRQTISMKRENDKVNMTI